MDADVSDDEADSLGLLLAPVDKNRFQNALCRLNTLFNCYATTCPAPLPAPGLIVTPEIRTQCERYLPIAGITSLFNRLYAAALTCPPILSSTPFHNAMSWADAFSALAPEFQFSPNPARLLETLLDDHNMRTRFLFASFLPNRFYGVIGRYPEQRTYIREWLTSRRGKRLRCLDAACGTGEDTYGLALLLSEKGFSPETIRIDGWTVEPLEVWAATRRRFPHDHRREVLFRKETTTLFEQGFGTSIRFRCVDLTTFPLSLLLSQGEGGSGNGFDLIVCNGLLGGPNIHERAAMNRMVENLSQLLTPGGLLLAADNFHGGWKKKCPHKNLRASFEQSGLNSFEAGEGLGGLKPY